MPVMALMSRKSAFRLAIVLQDAGKLPVRPLSYKSLHPCSTPAPYIWSFAPAGLAAAEPATLLRAQQPLTHRPVRLTKAPQFDGMLPVSIAEDNTLQGRQKHTRRQC